MVPPGDRGRFGVVAVPCGDFDAARSHLERATAGLAATDQHRIDAVWFDPGDLLATAQIGLALVGLVRGDLAGAEAELAQAAPGPNSSASPRARSASPSCAA